MEMERDQGLSGRSPASQGRAAAASQPSREGVSGKAGIPNAAPFTPGPWHVERGDCIVSKGRSLAAVWPASLLGGELPQEANARLIAAAPDLAQAAADAERGISEAVRVMDLMGRGQDARNLAIYGNNLRAALRQARGEA